MRALFQTLRYPRRPLSSVRTAAPRTASRAALTAASAACLVVLGLAALAFPALASAKTVVSIEFDDGLQEEFSALPMLESHGMHATFFVNSGVISLDTANMTWQELTELQAAGNEIGSHTVTHADLPTVERGEMEREVCNDRVTLPGHGITQTDFAYPYGAENATTEEVVGGCGDNSARGVGGVDEPECTECLYSESIPPLHLYDTADPESVEETTPLADRELGQKGRRTRRRLGADRLSPHLRKMRASSTPRRPRTSTPCCPGCSRAPRRAPWWRRCTK